MLDIEKLNLSEYESLLNEVRDFLHKSRFSPCVSADTPLYCYLTMAETALDFARLHVSEFYVSPDFLDLDYDEKGV